jgi:hypothetical protein
MKKKENCFFLIKNQFKKVKKVRTFFHCFSTFYNLFSPFFPFFHVRIIK